MFQKILVPLDGSKLAEKILPRVEKMGEFCRAEVHVLRVVVSLPISCKKSICKNVIKD